MFPILDAIKGVAGGVGGALSARAASKAAKDQANLNNAFLAASDAGKQDIIAQLKANGFDPYGPSVSSSASTGGGSSSSRSRSHQVSDTSRTTAAENQGAENALRARMESRLANKAGVSQGEILNQVANINRSSAAASRAVANKVASRGVGGAGAAAAYTPGEIARTQSINDFLASVPQLARQRQMEDEGAASQFLNERAGQHQVSDTDTVGNQSYSSFGNQTNTGGPDVNTLLSLALPTGPKQSLNTGISTFGSALTGAAGMLPATKR